MNNTAVKQYEVYKDVEDYEENCYLFSPSISKRRTVSGKSYYIRRYFRGGNDFETALRKNAIQQANKNVR